MRGKDEWKKIHMKKRISCCGIICSECEYDPAKTPEGNEADHCRQIKNIREYREIEKLVSDLQQQDARRAYESLKVLEQRSREDSSVYLFLDDFIRLIEHENSYFRNRGLQLIAANARWDEENKIDEVIDEYLKHIMDVKPITARQCIQALPEIAKYKEGLKPDIVEALRCAKPERYRESMVSLVRKDIAEALKKIGSL